jgi:hypothetical protein
MAISDVADNALFQFFEAAPFRRTVPEQSSMDILETVLPCAADKNPVAVFLPFQEGAWTYPELPAHVRRHRNLPL